MVFKLHFQGRDGTEDELIIRVDSIEEAREAAYKEMDKRGADQQYCWSERIV